MKKLIEVERELSRIGQDAAEDSWSMVHDDTRELLDDALRIVCKCRMLGAMDTEDALAMLDEAKKFKSAADEGRMVLLPVAAEGGTVYDTQFGKVLECETYLVSISACAKEEGFAFQFCESDFGKYVFSSREEAEKALERQGEVEKP